MKKNIIILFAACAFLSACSPSNTIQFDVNAQGLSEGVFVIKDQGQKTIYGKNIQNGKCTIKDVIEQPGFYELDIVKDGQTEHAPFEVYLEPGKYTVKTQPDNLLQYPEIESTSKKQQEISNYNAIYRQLGGANEKEKARLNKEFEAKSHSLSKDAYKQIMLKIAATEEKQQSLEYNALEQYVKKYPQSELSAHFMLKQKYAESPERYLSLYNQLSSAAMATEEGKELAGKLKVAAQLQPGKKAPAIIGKTADGKPAATVTTGKKLYLVDFWRSANQLSRTNHEKISTVYNGLQSLGFQVISVSLDDKALWWSTAVKDDKLPWPQVSDLKGNDSPNAFNWNITTIPTYYLVDGDWNIYKKDISLSSIQLEASQYLQKHH